MRVALAIPDIAHHNGNHDRDDERDKEYDRHEHITGQKGGDDAEQTGSEHEPSSQTVRARPYDFVGIRPGCFDAAKVILTEFGHHITDDGKKYAEEQTDGAADADAARTQTLDWHDTDHEEDKQHHHHLEQQIGGREFVIAFASGIDFGYQGEKNGE